MNKTKQLIFISLLFLAPFFLNACGQLIGGTASYHSVAIRRITSSEAVVASGDPATFTCEAAATGALSYHWQVSVGSLESSSFSPEAITDGGFIQGDWVTWKTNASYSYQPNEVSMEVLAFLPEGDHDTRIGGRTYLTYLENDSHGVPVRIHNFDLTEKGKLWERMLVPVDVEN